MDPPFILCIFVKRFCYILKVWYIKLVSKFNVGLKTFLRHSLSVPEIYGDLVYKYKKIVGRTDFSDQFKKIVMRYERIDYNLNVMRQSACLVFSSIVINN